ncbi:hypothetical protein EJ02DRAFT_213662 [Clathrospora elynae]|uniref:Zn(2)-C6 fungal-type domain-containing protein n=1 Tax=Clathrospora elynae TaxID=706981 RepID=A0A6A5SMN1_9PLEO|nr:hypothetical protein EJ02DRAFT_213662 [Clathrospora elynae]
MSYRGRPSKGCEACRARKVKCDETRPACSRCSKSGHDCTYRDQSDILFRNQTASAAQRAEESWRKRSKSHQRAPTSESSASTKTPPSDESSPPTLDDQHSSSGSQHSPSGSADDQVQNTYNEATPFIDLSKMTITPHLNPDFRRLAFERFVYDFVSPDSPDRPKNEPSDALWTFIPVLYQKAAEDSCLATAVDAVAYVNFANRCNAPHAEALGEECLGRSIAMLSKIIADKKLAATNEALLSVYLMGIFENLTSIQRKGTFIAHHHGANALLQLRTVEQYYSDQISARLYEVAYAQMLLGNLQSAKRPPVPTKDVVKAEEYLPSLYSNSNVFVIRLIWKEAMLHAKWHEVKQSPNPPACRLALQEILQTALELDGDFQTWETTVTPAWQYSMVPNTSEARSGYDMKWQRLMLECRGAPEEIHSYTSLKRCWIWGFYRTSRIFLLRDMLEILNWMFRFPEPAPPLVPVGSSRATTHASNTQGQSVPSGLSDMTLRMHHSFATAHLVDIIEKNCSALISSFHVPIHLKSFDDVVGMRGYICIWPLGIMDAVLSSGLVPDMNAPENPAGTNHASTQASSFFQPSNVVLNSIPGTSNIPPPSTQPDNLNSYATAPQFSELSNIRPKSESGQIPMSANSPSDSTPVLDPTAKKGHIFDSSPAHPYDHPVDLPPLDTDVVKPRKIDVAARREWVNRMLYYIATELGIKKALYVPLTEGFMQTVKPSVDVILGR